MKVARIECASSREPEAGRKLAHHAVDGVRVDAGRTSRRLPLGRDGSRVEARLTVAPTATP